MSSPTPVASFPIAQGRFPGQEHVAGNSKIPSVLYYDREGNVMFAGAEADNASISSQAEDECWIKAELYVMSCLGSSSLHLSHRFKLRLRPKSMKLNMNGMRLSRLPRNKSPVDVFGDFLHYLFRCTRSFIVDTHANGKALWQAVEHSIEFVLSHPNGWEGAQQTRMRRAAVYGGLIPDTDEGRARIRFVTEGEASLHACVQSGLAADVLSVRGRVIPTRFWIPFIPFPLESIQRLPGRRRRRWHARHQFLCSAGHKSTCHRGSRATGLSVHCMLKNVVH
jgi:hypothetical protein